MQGRKKKFSCVIQFLCYLALHAWTFLCFLFVARYYPLMEIQLSQVPRYTYLKTGW